ncbi:AAA family ATPase [candidate division KSB3 bacterium]|uniref:AAA family ATPase n=1 Tax=candidate division KSB3 bacterium TaxID=2044937 RepID=A0A9D5JXH8_9BACT|nr:AAA family ATPase [candidate division KSB3 bacterium]MBD3325968.1 AAA family ATPase [candidate division KSB3 bacterium]
MIPVSLQLKNFLSYGDDVDPLDFTEFDVACLSGNNGHGKSAILDAITWSLWGEARKAGGEKSANEGLVRIGTPEMHVEFVFDLEGDRYLVHRSYQRKSRKVQLDFQVFDETTNGYKPLTEQSVRATQQKIDATLRMNYETFINSAFILQGRVDEFTKKRPRKRKEIFAEILDLARYDQLAARAKECHKDAKNQCILLKEQIQNIEKELQHKAEYTQKLADLNQRIADIDDLLSTLEARRQALETQQGDLLTKQAQLQERTQHHRQLQTELANLDQKKTRLQDRLKTDQRILDQEQAILTRYNRYLELQNQSVALEEQHQRHAACCTRQRELEHEIERLRLSVQKDLEHQQFRQSQAQQVLADAEQILAREQEIEQGFQELQAAREQDERWEQTRREVDALEREGRELEKRIDQHKNHLIVEIQAVQRHIAELKAQADQISAREEAVSRVREAVAELTALEQKLLRNKDEGAECRSRRDALQKEQQRLREQLQDIEEKQTLLTRSETPQCPLCASDLDGRKREEIEAHFRRELQQLQEKIRENDHHIEQTAVRLEALRANYTQLERQMKPLQRASTQLVQAETALQESQKAANELQQLQQKLAKLQAQLADQDYAPADHAQLAELEQQIAALAYHQEEHTALKQRKETLTRFEHEHTKLQEAREHHQKASAVLLEIEQEIARLQAQLEQGEYARQQRAALQELLDQIQAIGYDEQRHAQIRQELTDLHDASQNKYELDQARHRAELLRQELEELRTEYAQKFESLEALHQQMQELEHALTTLPALTQEITHIKTEIQSHGRERDVLLQQWGTYENKLEHCRQLEREWTEKTTTKNQADHDQTIYGHLTRIFGKDGIQAYLIENAIPEVEDEANQLLARLTDNRTHITIESVKDLQSGGTKETLDIKISDELGTRRYEMYSGGEAFRVDFAIRIALAKLLANRAGTRLRTLVIDEGFGTQDAHGLEQLVEAIKTISADFEKILVITHLDDLKEAFPVRIEVVKYPDIGSQYQIVY